MSKIDHIAILVDDLEIAEKWYLEHTTGFVTFRDEKYVRLSVLVEDAEDLPSNGLRIEHRDGTIGVYVKDPFGNYLEYIWYSDDQKEVFLND